MKTDNLQVLVVDDDDDIRKLVSRIFENIGMRCHQASNVADGLRIAESVHPHVVILDLNMPVQDGYVFLETRQLNPALKNTPVIVLSAIRQKEAVIKAIGLGAADYVMKPIQASLLIQKIRKAIHDRDFSRYRFDPLKRPKVAVSAAGAIIKSTEVGFLLEAPIKIAALSEVHIASPYLDQFKCATAVIRRTQYAATATEDGRFLNDIAVIGISRESAELLRKNTKPRT